MSDVDDFVRLREVVSRCLLSVPLKSTSWLSLILLLPAAARLRHEQDRSSCTGRAVRRDFLKAALEIGATAWTVLPVVDIFTLCVLYRGVHDCASEFSHIYESWCKADDLMEQAMTMTSTVTRGKAARNGRAPRGRARARDARDQPPVLAVHP